MPTVKATSGSPTKITCRSAISHKQGTFRESMWVTRK